MLPRRRLPQKRQAEGEEEGAQGLRQKRQAAGEEQGAQGLRQKEGQVMPLGNWTTAQRGRREQFRRLREGLRVCQLKSYSMYILCLSNGQAAFQLHRKHAYCRCADQ